MGTFDDLVPQQQAQPSGGSGMFDDLVASAGVGDAYQQQLAAAQQYPQQREAEMARLTQMRDAYQQGSQERALATQQLLKFADGGRVLSPETTETPEGRLFRDALTGAGLAMGAGRAGMAMKAAQSPLVAKIGTWLAQRALPAAAQGGASALAGGMVREEGGSQGEQLAASMGTAVGMPLAARVAAPIGRTLRNIADYAVMPGGPSRAVGRVAVDAAGPRAAAIPPLLRGGVSVETGAEAAASAGSAEFSGLQRLATRNDPSAFSPMGTIPQRQEAFTKQAWDDLGQLTGPMRDAELSAANTAQSGQVLNVSPILQSLESTLQTPGFAASDTVQKVLGKYKTALIANADPTGKIDANDLYTIRKEMGSAIQGMAQKEGWDQKMTRGLVRGMQKEIDAAIEGSTGTQGWTQYLNAYKSGAEKIEGLETRRDAARRLGIAGAGAARQAFNADEIGLSLPNFFSRPIALTNALLQRAQGVGSKRSAKELARLMTPEAKAELAQLMEAETGKRVAAPSFKDELFSNSLRGLLGYGASQ